jgi:hypothetical protein
VCAGSSKKKQLDKRRCVLHAAGPLIVLSTCTAACLPHCNHHLLNGAAARLLAGEWWMEFTALGTVQDALHMAGGQADIMPPPDLEAGYELVTFLGGPHLHTPLANVVADVTVCRSKRGPSGARRGLPSSLGQLLERLHTSSSSLDNSLQQVLVAVKQVELQAGRFGFDASDRQFVSLTAS